MPGHDSLTDAASAVVSLGFLNCFLTILFDRVTARPSFANVVGVYVHLEFIRPARDLKATVAWTLESLLHWSQG